MQKNIRIMVYIKPPHDLNCAFYEIHKYLKKNFNSVYNSFYKGKWVSHIRLFGGTFYLKDENKIVNLIKSNCNKEREFEIAFSRVIYQKEYLLLMTNEITNTVCTSINNKLSTVLKTYKSSFIRRKYKAIASDLTEIERKRLEETGTIHDYKAHLSLAAFNNQYDLHDFLHILDFNALAKVNFKCSEYYIEVADMNYSHKKVYGPFKLKG